MEKQIEKFKYITTFYCVPDTVRSTPDYGDNPTGATLF